MSEDTKTLNLRVLVSTHKDLKSFAVEKNENLTIFIPDLLTFITTQKPDLLEEAYNFFKNKK